MKENKKTKQKQRKNRRAAATNTTRTQYILLSKRLEYFIVNRYYSGYLKKMIVVYCEDAICLVD